MSATKIEWADRTWNPVTGCTKVSPGCDHCYAEGIARRFAGSKAFPNGFDVTLHPERIDAPLRWRKPARVFVNSMSDLFHDGVSDEFIARVWAAMAATPQHTYQVLTKRHGRMKSLLNDQNWVDYLTHQIVSNSIEHGYPVPTPAAGESWWPLRNVWLGVSVEDQKRADLRIPALLDTPAAVRFLSCEPLLGPVNLTKWMPDGFARWQCGGCRRYFSGELENICPSCDREGYWSGSHTGNGRPNGQPISWVIVGGESGPGARPMHPGWARSLRDQCTTASVPFFFKQRGAWTWSATTWPPTSPSVYVAEADGRVGDEQAALLDGGAWQGVWKVGKHDAGRDLDGRTWDEFPATVTA